jgi:sugar lactone lactonase YvrE
MNGTLMNTRSQNSLTPWLAMLAILLLFVPSAMADKKKKKGEAPAPAKSNKIDHSTIDTSKLVWPLPPDTPRIKWVHEYYGEEKPKTADGQAPKKKQSWMDRVAGVPTTDSGAIKKELQHIFVKPYGMGVDSHGRLFVADSYVSAVFIFDSESKKVQLLKNGVDAKFGTMIGLTVDEADRVFVVDSLWHRVAVFGKDLKLETYFGEKDMAHPGGIAIDETNRILYVVDTDKDQIAAFDADDFHFLRTIGTGPKKVGDEDPGTLSKPSNVAVDKDGLIYVSDTMNNRIEVFDADGNFVSMFGKQGDAPGTFARPKGLAFDGDGHLWVVDAFQQNVQIYDKEGHLLAYFGLPGELPGQFSVPSGIVFDKRNHVYVAEQFKARVQEFQYITDGEAKTLKDERNKKAPAVSAQAGSPSANTGGDKKP